MLQERNRLEGPRDFFDRQDDRRLPRSAGADTYCYQGRKVAAMIEHCARRPGLEWLGRVIVCLAHTGLRISELVELRWRDVHLQTSTIRVADERSSRRKQLAGSARTTKGPAARRADSPAAPAAAANAGPLPGRTRVPGGASEREIRD